MRRTGTATILRAIDGDAELLHACNDRRTVADGTARATLQVGYAGLTLKQRAMFDKYVG